MDTTISPQETPLSRDEIHERVIDVSSYGIDPTEIATFQLSELKNVPFKRQDENGNIVIASAMPLMYMSDSQQPEIGRFYLALKTASALENLVAALKKYGIIYNMKVSVNNPDLKRIDQIVIYVHTQNPTLINGEVGKESSAKSVVEALREFYSHNTNEVVPVEMPFSAALTNQSGETMTGINFKQSSSDRYHSPNAILVGIISRLVHEGKPLTEENMRPLFTEFGYDPSWPAFLSKNSLFDFMKTVSRPIGLPSKFQLSKFAS